MVQRNPSTRKQRQVNAASKEISDETGNQARGPHLSTKLEKNNS